MSARLCSKALPSTEPKPAELLLTTSMMPLSCSDEKGETIEGKKIVIELGVVTGCSVQARTFWHDLLCKCNFLTL